MSARSERANRFGAVKGKVGFATWGFADQAMSSLSNFGAGLVAARSSSAAEFGAFSVAFATSVLGVGVVRALVSEVYSVRYSGGAAANAPSLDPDSGMAGPTMGEWVEREEEMARPDDGWDLPVDDVDPDTIQDPRRRYPHAGAAWGAALLISLVASAICAVAALLASGALRAAFVVLVFGMPFLILQDVARYILMARRDSFGATISDGTWVVCFALGIVVIGVAQGEFPGATASLAAWSFGAACGALAAAIRLHAMPKVREGLDFFRRVWRHSARYLVDWAALQATVQLGYYVLGFTAGLAVLGGLRSAMLLVGPLNIVVMGAVMVLVPELTRYRRRTGNRLLWVAAAISLLLELVTLVWVAVIVLVPESVLHAFLGDAAADARPLVPELLVMYTFGMLAQGPMVCLRATGDLRRGTRASLPAAPFQLFGAAAGAAIFGGAGGALIGSGLGSAVVLVLGTYQLVIATRSKPIVFEAPDGAEGNVGSRSAPPMSKP